MIFSSTQQWKTSQKAFFKNIFYSEGKGGGVIEEPPPLPVCVPLCLEWMPYHGTLKHCGGKNISQLLSSDIAALSAGAATLLSSKKCNKWDGKINNNKGRKNEAPHVIFFAQMAKHDSASFSKMTRREEDWDDARILCTPYDFLLSNSF